MAEAVQTAIVDLAVKRMVNKGYGEINCVMDLESELKRLQNTRTLIEAALLDAASSEQCSHTQQDTLEKLSCQLDRLHDLLDVRASRVLQKQVMSGSNFTKELLSFFSASNQLVARFKDARKVKDITKRLNSIAIDHAMIGRICSLPAQQARSIQRAESSHHVLTNLVVGRDTDRDHIVSKLSEDSVASETLSVSTIVGIGGMGKTTLAWYVYNDERMNRCFDVKFWVSATQDFDIKKVLVEMIIACGAGEWPHNLCDMAQLYNLFRHAIGGKKFLLVLDNIWGQPDLRNQWFELSKLLEIGAKGSKVLITTRDQKVAGVMDSNDSYMLHDLTQDDTWLLFQKIAFTQWQEPGVEAIGREIAKRCPKVPLVIRSIGGLLAGKRTVHEWHAFREDQLANFASYGRDVIHTLKFSFDQLDARLKLCITYCTLFPKAEHIAFDDLIRHWIALGYVKPQYSNQSLEEAGQEYVISLNQCGFFCCRYLDYKSSLTGVQMHDVMYELVLSLAGFKYKVVDSNTYEIDKRVRHLSFWKVMESSYWEMPSSITKIEHLQSFIRGLSMSTTEVLKVGNVSICDILRSTFKCLKVLDLHGMGIKKLPGSIGELICLRFLNLSTTEIVKLPDSITRLVNLQSLYLSNCDNLEELPRDMSMLVNLRHLKLIESEKLRHMPLGLGSLTNLRTLDVFVVGERTGLEVSNMGRLADLNQLNHLRGDMLIKICRESKYIMSSEISAVNLKMKENLRCLIIRFKNGTKEDERVLECLQPPCNQKVLEIIGYGGERLPSWMVDYPLERNLPNLVELYFIDCKACRYLCSLGRLPRLKILHLQNLNEVEYMDDNTTSLESATSIVDELPPTSLFPSLERLIVYGMPKLKGWWRILSNNERDSRGYLQVQQQHAQHQYLVNWKPPFPKLFSLKVENVELAVTVTRQHLGGFTSLKVLYIGGYVEQPSQQQEALALQNKNFFLPSLQELYLNCLHEFEVLPECFGGLSSLEILDISNCRKLKEIPEWIDTLTSLELLSLSGCPRLDSLPHQIANLPNLKTLQIHRCPILWERCQSPNGEYWCYIQHIPQLFIS